MVVKGSTSVLLMTDGRDEYLRRAIQSLEASLLGFHGSLFIHDDAGDEEHRRYLDDVYSGWTVLGDGPRRGFSGAMQYAWSCMKNAKTEYILHTEDDFLFKGHVCLTDMQTLLTEPTNLAQVVLLRQPWSAEEIAAGSIYATRPGAYTNLTHASGIRYVEHQEYWSCNPSLFRRTLLDRYTWPNVPMAECVFGNTLIRDGKRFAYLGTTTDAPAVTHIGHKRAGTGY